MDDLIEVLNDLGKQVNKQFPRINDGGCCVFAVLIGKELKKLKLRPRIIVAGSDVNGYNVSEARKNVKNIQDHVEWWRNGIYFYHVGVEFIYKRRVYHFDSNGAKLADGNLMGYPLYKGRMKLGWAEKLAAVPSNWNSRFNRDNIPLLQKRVERTFKPRPDNIFTQTIEKLGIRLT